MRPALARWVADADAQRHLQHFGLSQPELDLTDARARGGDYYLALVGDLFARIRANATDGAGWARLGNALAQFAADGQEKYLRGIGVSKEEGRLFASAAFYFGGYPASAYLTIRTQEPTQGTREEYRACYDLLARPGTLTSRTALELAGSLRRGAMDRLSQVHAAAVAAANAALAVGPDEWVSAKLLERLTERFRTTNIRAVLPQGGTDFWNPLVASLLNRRPSVWEFFPSQIAAIERGLLTSQQSFSLQMPTGAGKTALCETLLYWHAKREPSRAAVMLVPYRALASELRGSVIRRLNRMGIPSLSLYGGSVPSGEEMRTLDEVQVLVATPETLSGILGADAGFFERLSLVICDEGHLLDGGARGVGLELLLARIRSRRAGPPRFVFVSAITPNVEEINTWLGGTAETVVRSDYRPAVAEFALLKASGTGAKNSAALEMHPHEQAPLRYSIDRFLSPADFQWINPATGRARTHPFTSVKARAVASARKALPMGMVAVYAANKRGNQGALGLVEELLEQFARRLPMPSPLEFADPARVGRATQYLELEFGPDWIGTRALAVGAVLHHGDIPQETREVFERLLRDGAVGLAVCTSTLAEGVNLPIRTLVLYSVERVGADGKREMPRARDVKNLVGRAGRAGATTKGLVICANDNQWPVVEHVAMERQGEPVRGALSALVERLRTALPALTGGLTNQLLERAPDLRPLVDGIDATLVDLAAEEMGEEALAVLAKQLADESFASRFADQQAKAILQNVFELRARRVAAVRRSGKLGWVRETGARARMLDAVEAGLLPLRDKWEDPVDPVDPGLVGNLLEWAWAQDELQVAVRKGFRLGRLGDTGLVKQTFTITVTCWLAGMRFQEIARRSALPLDDLLEIHTGAVSYSLQTLVEQGVAVLGKILEAKGRTLADGVIAFPDHLRYGVPTSVGRVLAASGVRHRSAAVELGVALTRAGLAASDRDLVLRSAKGALEAHREAWTNRLGELVVESTLIDVAGVRGGEA